MIAPTIKQTYRVFDIPRAPNPRLYTGRRTGPDRFYSDKSSYVGIHARGGPDPIVKKDSYFLSLRGGHYGHRGDFESSPGLVMRSKSAPREVVGRGPQRFYFDTKTYTGTHAARLRDTEDSPMHDATRGSRSSPSLLRIGADLGPERFFYDKASYTGTHATRALEMFGPDVCKTFEKKDKESRSILGKTKLQTLQMESRKQREASSKADCVAVTEPYVARVSAPRVY